MVSANKLGASAAANAIWMLMNICEHALIPVCGSDTCLCGTADKRIIAKKRTGDVGDVGAAPLPPSSVEFAVSSKYAQEPIPCPYCCIKKITNVVTHICASVSSISRPTTIPVPSHIDAVLDEDDEYLSVRDSFRHALVQHTAYDCAHRQRFVQVPEWLTRRDSSDVGASPLKSKPLIPMLSSNLKSRSLSRVKEVKGAGVNSISADEQER
jgi:hypothetical protein